MATIGMDVKAKNLRVGDIIDLGIGGGQDIGNFRYRVTQAPRKASNGVYFIRAVPADGGEEITIPFWSWAMAVTVIARRNK